MGKIISRYELACDLFMNLCYLYDYGCCCIIQDRWLFSVLKDYTPQMSYDLYNHLMELQYLTNMTDRWKEEMIEIEE